MKFKLFLHNDKKITNFNQIKNLLKEHNCTWLLDCEFENAIIELKNNTIIWKDGDFYFGVIPFIIWERGNFRGGIIQNGIFLESPVSDFTVNKINQ